MLTVALATLAALAALAAAAVGCRAAGRACYRIDRDAYHRAQTDWAAHRRAQPSRELTEERSA